MMKTENLNGTESSVSKNTKSDVRRTFLKRATASAVLTSLPIHSVWGAVCTVSGAMSGNLSGVQRHSNCEMPVLPAGCGPDKWKELVLGDSSKVAAIFNSIPDINGKLNGVDISNATEIRNCYTLGTTNKAVELTMNLNNNLIDTASFQTNIYQALVNPAGIDKEVAAVWLNVYFGLGATTAFESATTADSIVDQLLSYIIVQERAGTMPTLNGEFFNFIGGTTSYSFAHCPMTLEAMVALPIP
jgi:hypothetical protein